jgi:hypothetical protein
MEWRWHDYGVTVTRLWSDGDKIMEWRWHDYGVTVIWLNKLIFLCVCIKAYNWGWTEKIGEKFCKQICEKIINKIHHKPWSELVCYLYTLDQNNARKMDNSKHTVPCLAALLSCKLYIVRHSEINMKFQKLGIFKSLRERMEGGEEKPTPGLSKFFVIMGHTFRNRNTCRPHQLFNLLAPEFYI